MRLAILAAAFLLAVAAPHALAAQSTEPKPDPKVDSTSPPVAPGICVDRNRDRKCDRPEKKSERRLREAGEIAAPIARSRISRRKGGTRGTPSNRDGRRMP